MSADAAPDVLVTEDFWEEPFDRLADRWRVRRSPDAWMDDAVLRAQLTGVRVLVVRNRTRVDYGLLAAAPSIEVVARAGVGLDNIDVAAADELGVVVVAPLGANAVSVAEHTLALALALARELRQHDAAVRDGHWIRRPGRELAGRTWGLLGAGSTARAVARLVAAFGMRILAFDPYVAHEAARAAGIELVPLERLLRESDVVSVHLPATLETRGLLDKAAFGWMPHGSLFINVGRGEVVDELALADALRSGRIAGAGLDVRSSEPPHRGPLDDAPNVLFTPHVAGITKESQLRIAAILAANVATLLGGGSATHPAGAHTMPIPRASAGACT